VSNSILLCYPGVILTCFMEQSPSWEASPLSSSKEISRILRNPKAHYRIYKCPPPVPFLNQFDPIHTPTSHFLKIHLNITHLRLGLPSGLFPSGLPTKTLYTHLLSPIHATCSAHLIQLVSSIEKTANCKMNVQCDDFRVSTRCAVIFTNLFSGSECWQRVGELKLFTGAILGFLDGDWGNSSNSSNRINCC